MWYNKKVFSSKCKLILKIMLHLFHTGLRMRNAWSCVPLPARLIIIVHIWHMQNYIFSIN